MYMYMSIFLLIIVLVSFSQDCSVLCLSFNLFKRLDATMKTIQKAVQNKARFVNATPQRYFFI